MLGKNLVGGHRPDITPAQIIGAAGAALGPVCILVGIHLSKQQIGAVDDLKVIALGLLGADAFLRVGRAHADAKIKAASFGGDGPPKVAVAVGDGATAETQNSGAGAAGGVTVTDATIPVTTGGTSAGAEPAAEEDLPTDAEEFGDPPPPDESNAPVQPSQDGTAGEG